MQGEGGRQFVLVRKGEAGRDHDISITQADIRQLQLAKSAIYSGIMMLRDVMGIADDQIRELMLCGGFGNYISIESSVKIRLLPPLPVERITYMGNAAAIGAQMALLSETERLRAFDLAREIEHVALAARPEFQAIFVEGMNFTGTPFDAQERGKPQARGRDVRGREPARRAMQINLLFGFLGSGKTTLAKHLLAERGRDVKTAVIVNEFGEVGVDGDILRGNNVDVVELNSGCLCCTLRGSLMMAVEELREKAGVERVIVEATGVAQPSELVESLADSSLAGQFDVGPLVTVVDAAKFPKLLSMLGDFYLDQVESADLVIVNKIDLVSAGRADGGIAPGARDQRACRHPVRRAGPGRPGAAVRRARRRAGRSGPWRRRASAAAAHSGAAAARHAATTRP